MNKLKFLREKNENSYVNYYLSSVGVREKMPPEIVNRLYGSNDWLLIFFHDPVLIKDKNGVNFHSQESVILWNDTDRHYYGNPEKSWSHSWVHFQSSEINSFITSFGLPTNKVMYLNHPSKALDCLMSIYCELTEEITPDNYILGNFLRNALFMTARSVAKGIFKTNVNRRLPSGIMRAKKMVDTNPSNRFTLKVLAKTANLSISRFCAEFKRVTGVPPIEYLISNRMRLARYLLEDHNRNISDIANILGYSDISQFSKQFKKHFKVTPTKITKNSPSF